MDGDRVAAPALDDDGPPEERADGRGLDVEPATEQREAGQLRLQVRRAAVELGAPVHEEPDDAALEGGRIGPSEVERGQPGGVGRVADGLERVAAGIALDQQHGRHAGPRERDRQVVDLRGARGDHRQRRARDDREIAGLERLECRDAWLEDADPADLASGTLLPQLGRADRAGGREQCAMQLAERRHAGAGRRTATRSSRIAPNSRSTST